MDVIFRKSILMYGVISLPGATSYDKQVFCNLQLVVKGTVYNEQHLRLFKLGYIVNIYNLLQLSKVLSRV